MIYMEQGYHTLGIGRVNNCSHCGNTQREVVKRKFFNQDLFYFIPVVRTRGEVLVICNICNWGAKLDPAHDAKAIAAILWDGRENTKSWFKKNDSRQQRGILNEYRKLGLDQLIAFVTS